METKVFTDQELIKRISNNDKAAFRILFDRYYKLMLGTAINLLKDVDSSKDAVQEVYIQLWKNRDKITITSSIENYLKRAVINRSLNQIKYKSRFESEPDEEQLSDAPTSQEQIEAAELKSVIDKAIETIPERSRLVFKLRRQEDLSLKEIAKKLDISPKTVENQLTKALKILKDAVKPYVEKMDNS